MSNQDDFPLPFDVKIRSGTHKAGTSFKTLLARMEMIADYAQSLHTKLQRRGVPPLTDDMLRYAMGAMGTGSPQDAERFRLFWRFATEAAKTVPQTPTLHRHELPKECGATKAKEPK